MKILTGLLLFLFLVLQYQLWIKPQSIFDAWKLQRQLQTIQADNQALREKNDALLAEVNELKKEQQAIEQHARHDLGMVKSGEKYYRIVK
jgi:cell division protein FtsB